MRYGMSGSIARDSEFSRGVMAAMPVVGTVDGVDEVYAVMVASCVLLGFCFDFEFCGVRPVCPARPVCPVRAACTMQAVLRTFRRGLLLPAHVGPVIRGRFGEYDGGPGGAEVLGVFDVGNAESEYCNGDDPGGVFSRLGLDDEPR